MGLRYVRRNRMESLPAVNDAILASIGERDFKFDQYDEGLVFDMLNAQLDKAQASFRSKYQV